MKSDENLLKFIKLLLDINMPRLKVKSELNYLFFTFIVYKFNVVAEYLNFCKK